MGVALAIALVILGNALMAYMIAVNGSSPVLLDAHGSVK